MTQSIAQVNIRLYNTLRKDGIRSKMTKTIIKTVTGMIAAVVIFGIGTYDTDAATLKKVTNVYITKTGNTYHVNYDCDQIDSKRIYAKTLYNILNDGNYKMCKTCAKNIGMDTEDSQNLTVDMLPYETRGEIHTKEGSEDTQKSSEESLNSNESSSSGSGSSNESVNSSESASTSGSNNSNESVNDDRSSGQSLNSSDTNNSTGKSNASGGSNSKKTTKNSTSKTSKKSSSGNSSSNSGSGDKELMTQKQRRNKFLSKSNPARGKKPKTEKRPENDGFEYADFAKFNSYNSDNGLGGTQIYLTGTIKDIQAVKDKGSAYGVAIMVDDTDGYQWYMRANCSKSNFDVLKADLKGKKANIFGKYAGYSGVTNRPMMDMIRVVDADGNDIDMSIYR